MKKLFLITLLWVVSELAYGQKIESLFYHNIDQIGVKLALIYDYNYIGNNTYTKNGRQITCLLNEAGLCRYVGETYTFTDRRKYILKLGQCISDLNKSYTRVDNLKWVNKDGRIVTDILTFTTIDHKHFTVILRHTCLAL